VKLSTRSTNKLVGVGVAFGLATASLNGVAPAHAWCVGLSGINIHLGGGGGCSSTLGNFAIGLGPNAEADSNGLFTGAIAFGNTSADATGVLSAALSLGSNSQAFADGILNWAVASGANVEAFAGAGIADFANFAFNLGNATDGAASTVDASFGGLNFAANIGGVANAGGGGGPTDMTVLAGGLPDSPGFGTLALNLIGNRNDVEAFGFGAVAINIGSVIQNLLNQPNGSDGVTLAGDFVTEIPSTLSLALNWQPPFLTPSPPCEGGGPCGNFVSAEDGFLSLAASIAQINEEVIQSGLGFNINNLIQIPGGSSAAVLAATEALAATGTQKKLVRPDFSTRLDVSDVNESLSSAGPTLKSVSDQIKKSAKKASATVKKAVKNATSGLQAGAKGGKKSDSGAAAGVKKDRASTTTGAKKGKDRGTAGSAADTGGDTASGQ
jgi:hypothetical protein